MQPDPQVILYVHSPTVSSFDPSIETVGPITKGGTPVPERLVKRIQQKARRYGLSVTRAPKNR